MEYKNCTIERSNDAPYTNFSWAHDSYDGAPDSPTRHLCGHGNTINDCLDQIDNLEEIE